ncbi:hypothetical protein CY34DRAFT_8736 [Suillus luteus UH-Slu-Lm8-n1]|uniref:Uncharacterized protein n=1 Tax=Suillus luteus UH-Slu-Lm8-n1 TaxID=930992 RepID=A0A0D0ABL5_9AGAM|nr:hypothetical protein CY34DRAFT_8736 [Suillus luteus UH-Slu-Lm8-n1]
MPGSESTPPGDYGSSHNPTPPRVNQHNRDTNSSSYPSNNYYYSPASSQQVYPSNNYYYSLAFLQQAYPSNNYYYSPASSQQATANTNFGSYPSNNYYNSLASSQQATTFDNTSSLVPGSPWSRNAVLPSSSHNSPTPDDIGGTGTSSHCQPATGRAGFSPHTFSMPGFVGWHASPMSWNHGMASDMHSSVSMMANHNAVPSNPVRSAPDRYNPGDARSWAGMVSSHGTSLTPGSMGHASSMSRNHSSARMMASQDAASVPSTPDNFRTAVSYGPSRNVSYPHVLHDPGVMNRQSELPIGAQPPSRIHACKWGPLRIYNGIGKTSIFVNAQGG